GFYAKPKLLIIDELGYLPFEPNAAHLFFQLVSRRYERGSLLLTSNRPISEWGTVFGDAVVATAILDRLLHHSHVVTIRGDSYRLRAKRRSGLLTGKTASAAETTGPGCGSPPRRVCRAVSGRASPSLRPPATRAPSVASQGVSSSCRRGTSSGCRLTQPRACGEHTYPLTKTYSSAGSAPRVRGAHTLVKTMVTA